MDNEKDMKLNELFYVDDYNGDFVEVVLAEGMATEQTDKMRSLVGRAKELATRLDDRMSIKFRNEFNKQLNKFNVAVSKGENIRNMEHQLLQAGSVFNKYLKKV